MIWHGSVLFAHAAVSRRSNDEMLRALRDGLRR